MAEGKKAVLLYCDLITTFDDLTDEEAGRLIKHFLRYVNDKNPEAPDRLTKLLFDPIKNDLKRDLNKWEQTKDAKSTSGIIGNLKRWHLDLYEKYSSGQLSLDIALSIAESRKVSHTDVSQSQSIANIAVNVKDIVKDNVIVNDTVKEKKTNKLSIEQFQEIARTSFKNCKCFFGDQFKIKWFELIQSDNWKKKKQSAFDYNLKRLMDFEEEFAIELVISALAGEYKGVVFPNTKKNYKEYLNQKNGTGSTSSKEQSRNDMANLARQILSDNQT